MRPDTNTPQPNMYDITIVDPSPNKIVKVAMTY